MVDPPNQFIGYSSYMTDGGVPDTPENYASESFGGQVPLNLTLEAYVRSKKSVVILMRSERSIGNSASVSTIVMDFPVSPSGSLMQAIISSNNIKSP
ncbi:unnamed protein product [Fusarium equiseti]|uniref:Uncharacterized protein n=1 Tax=Fusarium equiseti TaxID=61235 RepID=A0A8J2NCE9_FUSEQ|nr:unnamed protein product [Fusarium equiseti]